MPRRTEDILTLHILISSVAAEPSEDIAGMKRRCTDGACACDNEAYSTEARAVGTRNRHRSARTANIGREHRRHGTA